MLDNFFAKPLDLVIKGKKLSLASVADFEFSISSKVEVPSTKVIEMYSNTAEQLQQEAKSIKKVEQLLVDLLCRFVGEPDNIKNLLKKVDVSVFSKDHDWRDIIVSLNDVGDEFNPFRQISMVKYIQYLSARQQLIKYLCSQKKKGIATTEEDERLRQDKKMKETLVILESEDMQDISYKSELGRIPKGESIELVLTTDSQIRVGLSKHQCTIKMIGGRVFFIDPSGQKYILYTGRNEIGRGASSVVPIDTNLRDISRLHLVIEVLENNTIKLTDFSAHGTYIKAKFLL